MQLPLYLDYMATTPVDPAVALKMNECLLLSGAFGNASSRGHRYGWEAGERIRIAREQVAHLVQADPKEMIWTSGATEANNLAIKGAAAFYQRKGRHLITLKTEHKSVLEVFGELEHRAYEVSYLTPQPNGLLELEHLAQAMRRDTVLVSVMHVNNETGVIQDIEAIARLCKQQGVLLHVDAAQSVGKIVINLAEWPVDLMSFSAHKVYGPKGVGALYVRRKPRIRLEAQMHGGGQEGGLRSGTLATHQIVGMGEAFRLAEQNLSLESARIQGLRDHLWEGIKDLEGVELNGDFTHRVAGNLNVRFNGLDGESLLVCLRDLAVSSGSACDSATIQASHVLLAMGLTREEADSSLRFSLGRFTTQAEIDYAIAYIRQQVTQLRKRASKNKAEG